ncbi:MAG: DUF1778 domain-containing protein [Bifidobacteriaceae bacterium]|jgi:uncharacterized protein (DUF1778 family)|nr:DUF1778 domain-containing protein [Bifidobacteriaceae bacterium]
MAAKKDARIAVRLSSEEDWLIRRAARTESATMTDFTVSAAVHRARDVLADRRVFQLDDESWQAFVAALDRSPADRPGLRRLLAGPSVFDQA